MSEKIEKTIELSNAQYVELQDAFKVRAAASKLLGTVVEEVAKQQVVNERDTWDEMARFAGYGDAEAAGKDGKVIRISWVRRCIDVIDIGDE